MEWQEIKLSEMVKLQGGFAYPSQEFRDSGIPVLKIANIKTNGVDTSGTAYVSEALAAKTSQFLVKNGDILISMTGSWQNQPNSMVGRISRYRGLSDQYLINQRVGRFLIKDRDKLDTRYLYYVLSDPNYQEELVAIASGSANQANISAKQVEGLKFPYCDIKLQRAIARILGALDDKIDINRRMNRTLEAMAQALFQSWFVDFEPVSAKIEGRKPVGMDAATAALFPAHFQDTDMGPIPAGWRSGSTADIARYVNGKNFTKDATGTGRMVIRIADLNSGAGGAGIYNDVHANSENTAYPGDLLFAWSGSLDIYRWHRNESLVNQHIFKVICDEYPQWFVYFHLQEAISFFQGVAADKATTMGHIKREHLSQPDVALPPTEVIVAASRIIQPMYDRIHRSERQILSLATKRDTLLPQLLSGELKVGQAEEMMEGV